jgi:hypothetical protein
MHNHPLRRHRRNPTAAVFATALALGLAVAGCGGSTVRTTTTAQPNAASTASGSHTAIVNRCAAQAQGDPAAIGLCLASHGVVLPSHGKLVTCVQDADTRSEVTDCLAKAAQ